MVNLSRLRLPVVVSPMFLASGPELVVASCLSGVIGTFPAANARTPEQLDEWFDIVTAGLEANSDAAPFGVNIVLSNTADPRQEACLRRRPPIVITSLGDPTEMAERVHDWGGRIFHDVVTVHHAEKAAKAGVDGLVLVCAGAGGHAGALNPFAFLPQIRASFGGLIVLGGGMSEGSAILAARTLGADLVYMGTRFLATQESRASAAYKAMVVEARTRDILYTPAICGLPASFMRQSIEAAGLDPAALPTGAGRHSVKLPEGVRAWRDIWSAGQGVGLIRDIPPVADLVKRLIREYAEAAASFEADVLNPQRRVVAL